MPGRLRRARLGRCLGGLAVALSFAFIGERLWQGCAWDLLRTRLEPLLLATLVGALLYGLSGFLLSAAWRQILAVERPPGPAARYHAVYGRTQIAKYLPGNVFHFVGRQVLGRELAHSQAALALASLLEAALLVTVALSLALPLALARLGAWSLVLLAAAAAALALTFAAPGLLRARCAVRSGSSVVSGGAPPAARLLRALALHVTFFASAGAVLWLLTATAGGSPAGARTLPTCVAALAFAWATGFVVPGAAAGMGVREAMLVIALEGALAPEIGAAVALALRVATTAGDGIFCVLALALPLPDTSRSPSVQVKLN